MHVLFSFRCLFADLWPFEHVYSTKLSSPKNCKNAGSEFEMKAIHVDNILFHNTTYDLLLQ